MRFSSSLLAITTLALTVSASVMDKRALTEKVETCVKQITYTSSLMEFLSKQINSMDASPSTSGLLFDEGVKLIDGLNSTSQTCCASAVQGTVADDSDALVKAFGTFVPKIEDISKALISKRSIIATQYSNGNIQTVISFLDIFVSEIAECLTDRVPKDQTALATDYNSRINVAFKTAEAAYPPVVNEAKPTNPAPEVTLGGSSPPS